MIFNQNLSTYYRKKTHLNKFIFLGNTKGDTLLLGQTATVY